MIVDWLNAMMESVIKMGNLPTGSISESACLAEPVDDMCYARTFNGFLQVGMTVSWVREI